MSVTPAQRTVCCDLMSRATGLNGFDDARTILDSITALVELGETGISIVQWLNLLPRARGKQQLRMKEEQLTLNPVGELHPKVQHQLRPVNGQDKMRKIGWLLDPDNVERPTTGHCVKCGVEFRVNPFGRPSKHCENHRKPDAKKWAS